MTRLSLRVRQMPCEPPHGVLMRLAARHRERDVRGFASACGCAARGILAGKGIDRLAGLARMDAAPLRAYAPVIDSLARTVSLAGETLLLNDWSVRHRRWCAACFRADRVGALSIDRDPGWACWHRASWDVRSAAACPAHRLSLAHACPSCGSAQAWSGPSLDECACGGDLAMAEQVAEGPGGGAAARYVAGRLGTWERSSVPLADSLSLKDAVSALERLGECAMPDRRRRGADRGSTEAAAVRDEGLRVALGWPWSFRAALDAALSRAQAAGAPDGMIGAYGWIHSAWIARPLPAGLEGELRGELARHAVANGVVARDEPLFGAPAQRQKGIKAASRSLGVSNATFAKALEDGAGPRGSRRSVAFAIAAADVEKVRDRLAAEIGLAGVARILGVGRKQAGRLLDAGVVPPTDGVRSGRRTLLRHVEALLDRMHGMARPPGPGERLVPIAAACKAKGVKLDVACSAILDGRLAVLGPGDRASGLAGLMVRPSELRSLRGAPPMSVEAAAAAIGVHHDATRWLVGRGVLRRLGADGRLGVARESIEGFKARFVTGAALAAAAGTSPRKLAANLAGNGIVPAFGPPGCRQAIYERAHVRSVARHR